MILKTTFCLRIIVKEKDERKATLFKQHDFISDGGSNNFLNDLFEHPLNERLPAQMMLHLFYSDNEIPVFIDDVADFFISAHSNRTPLENGPMVFGEYRKMLNPQWST